MKVYKEVLFTAKTTFAEVALIFENPKTCVCKLTSTFGASAKPKKIPDRHLIL